MKKVFALMLALVMLLACGTAMAEETKNGLQKDIVVLFTSDVHCGVEKGFGYAGLMAIKQQLAKENDVLLVDNGDAVEGAPLSTVTRGSAVITLMNALGYDVVTLGNHEFNFGMETLKGLMEQAEFPYISANFTYQEELLLPPYAIREVDGVKIGFVGVTTPKALSTTSPKTYQDENGEYVYGFMEDTTGGKLYQAVQSAVDAARQEGAQYVVCMAHLGIEEDCSPWMSTELIANTTGIDALLDGHSHSLISQDKVLNKEGREVLHCACGTELEAVGYFRIAQDGTLSTGLYTWFNETSAPELLGIENGVSELLKQVDAGFTEMLNTPVAKSDVDLVIYEPLTGERLVRKQETNLGDLVTDAYRQQSGAEIAFVNGGGIRCDLKRGDITQGDLLECHPYGNRLCMVKTTGQKILDALEWFFRSVPEEASGYQQISGLTLELHTYLPSTCLENDKGKFAGVAGERRVRNVLVNGEPIDPEREYTLASHNYLLKEGGSGIGIFMEDELLLDDIKLDYQVVIDYITEALGGIVGEEYADLHGQGRVKIVSEPPAV